MVADVMVSRLGLNKRRARQPDRVDEDGVSKASRVRGRWRFDHVGNKTCVRT